MSTNENDSTERVAKVLIVDDHPAVREALGLRIARTTDLMVCGEASDSTEALGLINSLKPDVAVIDIALRGCSGIELIKRAKDRDSNLRILVWSMYSDGLYAERALRAGALGYVTKDQATDQIINAIRQVLTGRVFLSDAASEALLHRAVGGNMGRLELEKPTIDLLSDRELEVLRLIGQGQKTQMIATQLHLSVKTVETYRDRIREKLRLSDGTELLRYAVQWVMENG